MDSDDQPVGDSEAGRADSLAAPSAGANDEDRNADRRDDRSRKAILQRLFAELGVDSLLAKHITDDLASLMPPRHRMSKNDDVTARLVALLERDAKAPLPLQMKPTKVQLDVLGDNATRSDAKLADHFQSDERLLAAYVANERLRGLVALQLAEHDSARRTLTAELARRYTAAEQWRYKLPKFLLPLVAVMNRAGVQRDDMRLGNTLLAKIINVVADHFARDGISHEELREAASITAEQFDEQLREDLGDIGSPYLEERQLEETQKLQTRLQETLRTLVKPVQRSKPGERHEAHKKLWWSAKMLAISGAGIDTHGRPVFKSIEDFREALEYLIDGEFLAPGRKFEPPEEPPYR